MGKTILAIVAVAAAIAIVVFAPEIGLALGTLLGISTTTAIAIVSTIGAIALSLSLGFAARALGIGAPSAKDAVGPPQVFRQAISNSFIVYGKRRVGGLLVFFHAKQSGSDHYRYFAIACAGHRCQGVVQWRLGDEIVTVDGSNMVTSGKFAGACWLWFQRGLASETANATFVAECDGKWTTNHKGSDVAAIYAKFKLTDAVVQAGMPNITADIEGRDEILDTRDDTLKYTNNGPLVFYDFMAMAREEGGFGAYEDEIPEDAWVSAQANVADETVDGEARYAIDGVIQTGAPPGDLRDALIVNMAGTYAYSGGKHRMRPGYWVASSGTLTEDDLSGAIRVSSFLSSDIAATEVSGTYVDPSAGYQGAPVPTWTRTPAADDVRQNDLDLAFITSVKRAQRIFAIMGKRAECEKTVVWPMNIAGIKVMAMDTWQLGTSRYGLDNYAWVIANWGLTHDPQAGPGVLLHTREENPEIYDDGTPVTPGTPAVIQQPTSQLETNAETIAAIKNSSMEALSISVAADGSGTISTHTRIYPDKTRTVNSGTTPAIGGVVAGDIVALFYRQQSREGGTVTYESVKLALGDEVPKPTTADPYLHPVGTREVPASGTSTGGSGVGDGGGGGGDWGGWDRNDLR